MRFIPSTALACAVAFALTSTGVDASATGQNECREIESMIDQLVDFADTTCLPTAGANGALTFLLVADKPLFEVPASKKAWVIVAVAAVAQVSGASPVATDAVWLSDTSLLPAKKAFSLTTKEARRVQRAWQSGEKTLDEGYSEIVSALREQQVD